VAPLHFLLEVASSPAAGFLIVHVGSAMTIIATVRDHGCGAQIKWI
jgi:hypothetical protein